MELMAAGKEPAMRSVIEDIASKSGYDYCYAPDGNATLQVFGQRHPDVLVLESDLPGIDGYEICRKLRDSGESLPIIFVLETDDYANEYLSYDVGGDDFVAKPINERELTLRIKARIRQRERSRGFEKKHVSSCDLEFDNRQHRVRTSEKTVGLSPKEYHILRLLASHPGETYTRNQIVGEVWGSDYVGETSSVAVIVRRIREKIESDPKHPKYLKTVLGVGYCFGD